ncbi:MAG TPA: cytochrome P450 [Xanthobacteraceae bacterium]|nr:cytochrome P450 [Xanthobacteraceae bacterium]
MSAIDTSETPVLAAPRRPQGRLTLRQFLRVVRENTLATYPPEDFDADILPRRLLWRRTFIINEPGAIRHVLLDNAQNYTKSEVGRRILEPGLGRGLLTSEGETWRRHRRIMAPSFDPRSIVGYAPVMTELTERLLAQWDALPAESEVDVAAAMMHTTLHIISRAMFSSDSDEVVDVVERGVGRYQTSVRPSLLDLLHCPIWLTNLLSPQPSTGIFNEFDQSVDRLLTSRGRAPDAEPKDLLARLIAARDAETGGGMTPQEVRDQVVTTFMAGHETTAQALAWTWYLLSQHPAAEAKLHDELAAVLGGRTPRHEDLSQLRYARMVIDESMRLYPPAHTLGREAVAADEILGHRIPAGATVLIVPWMLHRKPSLWENPDRFEPERFAPEHAAARHRYAYIPFGAGPRICIGAAFAIEEALLILATIAQRYRLRLKPGHPVEPQGLITLRPRYGLPMFLQRR